MQKSGRPPRKRQRRPLPNARPRAAPESEESEAELAPEFKIAPREVVAVEHPAIIQNLDNGMKTFGTNQPFERVSIPHASCLRAGLVTSHRLVAFDGTKLTLYQIINCTDPDECIPLYLRLRDPTCAPILSQSTSTQNVVLKITVPKRTGRRRKKGSQDPFTTYGGPELSVGTENVAGVQTAAGSGVPPATENMPGQGTQDTHMNTEPTARDDATSKGGPYLQMDNVQIPSDWQYAAPQQPIGTPQPWEYHGGPQHPAFSEHNKPPEPELCSHSRMDTNLRRKLIDNIGKYTCEAVAEVKQTHRFRGKHPALVTSKQLLTPTGLADFHQSTTHMKFFSKFRDTALTGNSMC